MKREIVEKKTTTTDKSTNIILSHQRHYNANFYGIETETTNKHETNNSDTRVTIKKNNRNKLCVCRFMCVCVCVLRTWSKTQKTSCESRVLVKCIYRRLVLLLVERVSASFMRPRTRTHNTYVLNM